MLRSLRSVRSISNMTRSPPQSPLIAIIGATGTGKSQVSTQLSHIGTLSADHNSQLAVSLAQHFNGEIINGDALQLYAGLPIITNKISAEEAHGIPHHLLGCVGLKEQTWVVGTFVRRALKVIEEFRSRGKLPILVGGTHYYTQSLLFHDRLAEREDGLEQPDEVSDDEERQNFPLLQQPTEVLLKELKKVDPVMADRWHPKDRRKIQRSLEIYLKTGKRASEVYAEQRLRKTGNATNGRADEEGMMLDEPAMRFPTLLFWVHAEVDALRNRLDKRVDKMLEAGLLQEVRTLNAHAEEEAMAGRPVDETRGIWVSIGYKEYKDYVHALEAGDTDEKDLEKLKADALERTKIATRQYAKRQVRWIRIKLVNALSEANCSNNFYLLDGSDVSKFAATVEDPAAELTQTFLHGSPMPRPEDTSTMAAELLKPKREYDLSAKPETWTKQHCEVCDVTCVIQEQWKQHVGSKTHKKLVSKRKKQTMLNDHGSEAGNTGTEASSEAHQQPP